ncbi:MAG: acyl-CoA dehydrogenase N-terminal domain-containing protein, partial [Desulfotignum sp.]
MTQVISDRRDIEFVLHEQLNAESLSELHEGYADFNKKTIDLVISEARNFAVKELLPANKEGDQEGC